MIKECKVISRNSINMVVLYDDIEVQMPTDFGTSKSVYIKKEKDIYNISSYEDFIDVTKNIKKKTAELADKKSDSCIVESNENIVVQ